MTAEIRTATDRPVDADAPSAPAGPLALSLPSAPSVEWLRRTLTESQIRTLVATVAPGASDDELAAFFWHARRRGLDPFLKQVHFVKRRRRIQKPDGSWGYEEYAVHQTGIDGFRVIANRAKGPDGRPLLAGIKRGPIKDGQGRLIGGWAEVYRHDWREPARVELPFDEYVQTVERQVNGGKTVAVPAGLWATKPQTMIEKCAEAAALRMAFPEDLGDLYLHEEMDNAEHVRPLNRPESPPITSSDVAGSEVVDAEVSRAPAPVNSTRPGLFADAEAAGPDERTRLATDLVLAISRAVDELPSRPGPNAWRKVCQYFCRADALGPDIDPAALTDLLTWLRDLQAGKPDALRRYREIFPTKGGSTSKGSST